MIDIKYIKAGDTIYHPCFGEAKVLTSGENNKYVSIEVHFVNSFNDCTIATISRSGLSCCYPYPVAVVKADEPYTPPAPPKVAPPRYTAVRVWCGEGDAKFIRVSTGLLTDDNSMLLCYCSHGNDINDPELTPWENWEVLQ